MLCSYLGMIHHYLLRIPTARLETGNRPVNASQLINFNNVIKHFLLLTRNYKWIVNTKMHIKKIVKLYRLESEENAPKWIILHANTFHRLVKKPKRISNRTKHYGAWYIQRSMLMFLHYYVSVTCYSQQHNIAIHNVMGKVNNNVMVIMCVKYYVLRVAVPI